MLWMGRWVHHHATTTILVAVEFRELADLLGHGETTNDVKVQWLRPKTHMEWFPHPLHTYTRGVVHAYVDQKVTLLTSS
jgi:hypothetical protein